MNANLVLPRLKGSIYPQSIEITSEAQTGYSSFGYYPYVEVITPNHERFILDISPESLAKELEPRKSNNGDKFTGIKLNLRKESIERTASWKVE